MYNYKEAIKKNWAKFNKAQRKIVIAAAVLIILAWLFPPYKEGEVNSKGELTGWHVKWAFNKDLRDLVNSTYFVHPDGSKSLEIWEYATAPEIQRIEIYGILVLAVAAFFIAKKKGSGGKV